MNQRRIFAFFVTIITLCLVQVDVFAEQAVRRMFGKGNPFTIEELPAGKLKSQLQALEPEARARAMQWLHSFTFEAGDAAGHLRADRQGGIFYICPDGHANCDGHHHGPVKPGAAETTGEALAPVAEQAPLDQAGTEPEIGAAAVPVSSPPAYNSKPGATRHIYIDFNGAYVTGKAWSETDGTTTWSTWDCNAWSSDADRTTFSDAEQADIRRIWERIAEDYAPFDVNVTTDVTYDPDTYTGDKNKVGWLLVTPTTDKTGARCPHYGAGGVAYVGVYGNSNYFSTYQPAWVTPMGVANTAEAASHEMGHNMGLSHDGLVAPATPAEYYGGHVGTTSAPSWGPIMGTGYGRNVSQWSKGEYYGASQLQDDLSIINGRTPYRTDDHGGTNGTATAIVPTGGGTFSQTGIIERTSEADVFSFSTGAGSVTINANAYRCSTETWGGNVDINLELYDSGGTLIASNNPLTEVNASITSTLAAGTYFIHVKPSAAGTPTVSGPSGYTVYGSLGQYTISGNFILPGVNITEAGGTNVIEGGATDTYSISLGTAPTANVTVSISPNAQVTTSTSSVTFTTANWNVPQTVTVTAANDATIEGNHTGLITHAATSSDPSFNGVSIGSVIVNITDNDDIVLTAPNGGESWMASSTQNITWTSLMGGNVKLELLRNGFLDSTIIASTPNDGSHSWTIPAGQLPTTDYRVRITSVENPASSDTSLANFTVSAIPSTIASQNFDAASTLPTDWSNTTGSGTLAWTISTTKSHTPTRSAFVSAPATVASAYLTSAAMAIPSGMTSIQFSFYHDYVFESGWDGGLLEFSIDGGAWFDVTSSGSGASFGQNGYNIASVPSNYQSPIGGRSAWTGNSGGFVQTIVNLTDAAKYAGKSLRARWLIGTDNANGTAGWYVDTVELKGIPAAPTVGAVIAQSGGSTNVTEGGATDTYAVSLISQPTANVTVTVTPNSQVSVSPTSLTFTTSNWATAQTVTVTAVNDTVNEFAHNGSISHTMSSADANYNNLAGEGVVVNITDNDNTPPTSNAGPDQAVTLVGTTPTLGWSYSAWTGDADSGISDAYTYTAAHCFGNNVASVTVNNVPFTGGFTTSGTGWSVGGTVANWEGNDDAVVTGNSEILAQEFIYNGNPRTVTFSGLTIGQTYEAIFYSAGWDAVDPRVQTFSGTPQTPLVVNQNVYGNNNGVKISCVYQATATSQTLTITPSTASTFHLYAMLNRNVNAASATAILDGTVGDANGDTLNTAWSLVSGPSTVTFANPSAVDTTATFSMAGTYTLRLTASDPGAQAFDDVVITVNPLATNRTVTYNGNGSTGGTVPIDPSSPYDDGATVTVLGNTGGLVRTGYTFNGWNTAANGTGTPYAAGATFTISAATTLYAQWTANTYTVTFSGNGGSAPSPATKTVTFGLTYGTLATTSRTGYTFAGWFTAASGGTLVGTTTAVTNASNHTLYAQWTANTYTVTFNANGGGTPSPASQNATFGSPYGTLATVSRTGYTFSGWFTAASGGTQVTSATTVSTSSNHTLYAQWTANTYTVTFDSNGGGAPTPASKSVTFGSTYGTLATTSRTGYTFAGWFTAASGGTLVGTTTAVTTASNHTLYAQWTANTYTVTFDGNGGGVPTPASQNATFGSTYGTLATVTRTGYTFNGWFTAASGGALVTAASTVNTASNHTLFAQWTVTTYTVSYNGNSNTGGTAPSNQTKTHDVALTLATNSGNLTRTGYTFAGWNTLANGTGTDYAVGGSYTANVAITLYAKWTPNTYTVTFNGNGGSAPTPASKTITFGSTYGTLATTSRTGYTFAGWFTAASGGTQVTSGTTVSTAANHTLYAQWTANTYTVTFSANGGDVPSPTSKSVTYGSTYGALATVTRTGYTFTGWFTAASGGIQVTSATTVAITAAQTLYAQWSVNSYTISFDSAGGSAVAPITQNFGTSVTAPAAPTRTGYTFAGWSPALPATMPGNNLSVTAQWTANTYTVSFDANGGDVPVPGSLSVTFNAPYGSLATTLRSGYTFNGWFTAASGGSLVTSGTTVTVAGNHTLYAQWTQNFPEMDVTRGGTPEPSGGYDAITGTSAGTGAPLTYVIANSGTASLTLGSPTLSGHNNCTVVINTPPSVSIAPAGSSNFALTVTPTAGGAWSFSVSIANSDPDENPYLWTIHGVALGTTTTQFTATADTYVNGASTGTNYGTDVTFSIWNRSAGSNLRHGLVRFDISSIPTNATVTSAALDFVQNNAVANSVDIYAATGTWTETGATWTNSSNLIGATSFGTATSPGVAGGAVPTITLNSSGLATVQSWVSTPTGNNGFGVKTASGGNNANIDLRSRESASIPKLTVTYTSTPQVSEMQVTRAGSLVPDAGTDAVAGSQAGSGTQLTYAIANLGNANLSLTTPVSLMAGTNCSVLVNTEPAATVAASTSTPLVVTITPTAAGSWSATLSIANNDPDEATYNWTISGTATGSYTVNYSANNATSGTAPTPQNKLHGVDLTLAANTGSLARTGYTFAGWNTQADGLGTNYAAGGTYSANASVTLYAKWTSLYNTWASTSGLSGGNALSTANPDGDNLNNLQEFAFGMNPTTPATGALAYVGGGDVTRPGTPIAENFAAAGQPVDFHAVFARRKDFAAAGITYTVEFSADLSLWSQSAATPTRETGAASSGDMEAVSIPFPASVPLQAGGSSAPKFFRVSVSSN